MRPEGLLRFRVRHRRGRVSPFFGNCFHCSTDDGSLWVVGGAAGGRLWAADGRGRGAVGCSLRGADGKAPGAADGRLRTRGSIVDACKFGVAIERES